MDVQLFGVAGSKATRKAQRWFSERRIPVSYVDLRKRAPSPGELRRFVQRFGVAALLDRDSRTYRDQGLRYVSASDEDWLARMVADPTMLRLPLVRCANDLSVGDDVEGWQRLADAAKG
ncbi:MAG: arsenate reductase [Actinomycetota bacterium]|nr:arsenate reductase [Actinomycetota bacterium]